MSVALLAEEVKPLEKGNIIPNGQLISSNNEKKSLYEILENKTAVVVFYRGNW